MANKKSIMAISALLILFFHFWVSVFRGNETELFLRQIAAVGVDMFFFVSAYSLGKNHIEKYGSFVFSRFQAVYLKFILFAIVAFVCAKWNFARLLRVIFAVELFQKGGGAFLWFLPAIMLIYVIFPIFQLFDNKNRKVTCVFSFLIWLVGGYVFTKIIVHRTIFIVWNRIPVFLLGYYLSAYDFLGRLSKKKWEKGMVGIAFCIVGGIFAYFFAFKSKLQTPFIDMFFVMLIPLCIGLVILADMIPDGRIVRWIGSSTLEIYAVQMIFGYRWMNEIIRAVKPRFLVNIITFALILTVAVVIHYSYSTIAKQTVTRDK